MILFLGVPDACILGDGWVSVWKQWRLKCLQFLIFQFFKIHCLKIKIKTLLCKISSILFFHFLCLMIQKMPLENPKNYLAKCLTAFKKKISKECVSNHEKKEPEGLLAFFSASKDVDDDSWVKTFASKTGVFLKNTVALICFTFIFIFHAFFCFVFPLQNGLLKFIILGFFKCGKSWMNNFRGGGQDAHDS